MSLMSNPAGALSLQSRRLERRVARAALFCPDDESCGFPPAEAGTPYPEDSLGNRVPVVRHVAESRRPPGKTWIVVSRSCGPVNRLRSPDSARPATAVDVWGMESRL